MKCRDLIIFRQARVPRLKRIAARFEQQHAMAGFGKPGRDGAAAGAGADDDVVVNGGVQGFKVQEFKAEPSPIRTLNS